MFSGDPANDQTIHFQEGESNYGVEVKVEALVVGEVLPLNLSLNLNLISTISSSCSIRLFP